MPRDLIPAYPGLVSKPEGAYTSCLNPIVLIPRDLSPSYTGLMSKLQRTQAACLNPIVHRPHV
ncbi:hypothetical protein DPMN_128988 [Dreissena polymorpha]|nr:hypothetical protein DPMN_128988 [Dreissena polymorpha]